MTAFLLPLAFLLATTAAPAAEEAAHGKKMDCPMHDESATDADRAKHLDEMFDKLDANADGRIDREEFAKHHEDMRRRHADGDEQDEHAEHTH